MTLKEQILKEFDEKFTVSKSKGWEGHHKAMIIETPELLKSFLPSTIDRTREECAKEIEGMKPNVKIDYGHDCGGDSRCSYCDDRFKDDILSDAASKIREMK